MRSYAKPRHGGSKKLHISNGYGSPRCDPEPILIPCHQVILEVVSPLMFPDLPSRQR